MSNEIQKVHTHTTNRYFLKPIYVRVPSQFFTFSQKFG